MGVILIAYERESEQVALEQLLTSRGHQVVRAQNGLAALDVARREPPNLVVADIVLPKMDGFALCRKWKQDERLRSIPFIFYTRRHDDPKYERFALELGAEKFFARTAQPDALGAAVEQLLANVPASTMPRAPAIDEAAMQRAQALAVQKATQAQAIAQQKLEQAHAAALQKAEGAHADNVAKMRAEQDQALAKLRGEQEQALAQLRAEHEQAIAKLNSAHQHTLTETQQALERAQEAQTRLRTQIEEISNAQERVAAGEARFRRVFEGNPLPMWMSDHATHGFIAVNEAALALYGYKRAEFLALTTRALEADGAESQADSSETVTHRTKGGAKLQVALSSQAIEFDGRNADLVCAVDLTQRVEREAARAQEAQGARAQLDGLGDGYIALDGDDRIVDVNAAYCRMTGYPREQLLKMSLNDIEQGVVGDTTARLQFVTMDGVHRHETRHKRVDGALLDVEVSVGSLGTTQGKTTMLVRDVTQRRRELALQRGSQRQLEFLVDLFKQAESFDESAIVRRVIEQACDVTHSPLAYLYFVDSAEKTLTLAAWRDRSQSQLTMTTAEPRRLAKNGLFTECVKAKHPTSSNDLSWKPQTDGLPDLQRFLAVPMVSDDHTVAVLGVANRDAGYSEDDQRALTTMADGVWRVLQTKRSHARTLSSLQRTDVALQGMIESLVKMVEQHDPFTAGSSRRVAQLAVALGREAGLDGERQHMLRVAALLHDIGNIAVPAAILAKPGALNEQETALMRTHAEEGCKLLAEINLGAPIAEVIFEHHERIDGSGYPRGLKGEEISVEARILAIADTVEAMCSPRPYRPALGMEAALDEINNNAGKLFDLHFVTACTRLVKQRGFGFAD